MKREIHQEIINDSEPASSLVNYLTQIPPNLSEAINHKLANQVRT